MVRVGDVWDSTTEVLGGRAGLLAPLALMAFVLPSALLNALRIYAMPTVGAATLALLVALAVLLASLWGQLAVTAVASHPETTAAEARRLALARLPANLLVVLVLFGLFLLFVVLPPILILAATQYDFAGASAYRGAGMMPAPTPVAAGLLLVYSLALTVLGLWVSARLFLLNAVIVNEGRRIGAIRRSIALTRGLTWRLIGVLVLFLIVFVVTSMAAQSVTGLVFRLLLGAERVATARWLATVAGGLVQAAFVVVVQVFAARLWAAVTLGAIGAEIGGGVGIGGGGAAGPA